MVLLTDDVPRRGAVRRRGRDTYIPKHDKHRHDRHQQAIAIFLLIVEPAATFITARLKPVSFCLEKVSKIDVVIRVEWLREKVPAY